MNQHRIQKIYSVPGAIQFTKYTLHFDKLCIFWQLLSFQLQFINFQLNIIETKNADSKDNKKKNYAYWQDFFYYIHNKLLKYYIL